MERARDLSGAFPATRHSVLSLARSGDADARRRAHDAVAAAYWKPVYKYIRLRWRCEPDDAEDLTQGFFTDAIDSPLFDRYDPARGRFRTYLRTCVDGFVSNARKAAGRHKRGGGITHVALDFTTAEGEVREHALVSRDDPDALFREEWVRRIFELAIDDARAQCDADGKTVHFQLFEVYDLAAHNPGERPTYDELAGRFDLPVTQVTNFLALARRRFRAAVLGRVRELTASDDEFRAEVRDLLGEGIEP